MFKILQATIIPILQRRLVVQSVSCVQLFSMPMHRSLPCFPVLHCLLELAQTHVHWAGDAIPPSHPLPPTSSPLALIFPCFSVFSNQSALCILWPKDLSSSFSINPSNEYLGLISFSIDWFDLLAVLGTLKSLLPTEKNWWDKDQGPTAIEPESYKVQ